MAYQYSFVLFSINSFPEFALFLFLNEIGVSALLFPFFRSHKLKSFGRQMKTVSPARIQVFGISFVSLI